MARDIKKAFEKRKSRLRQTIRKVAGERKRLSVFRSNKHIYVQLIDDKDGITLASASSADKEAGLKIGHTVEAAAKVGALIAERAKELKVSKVVFDRGGYRFHGRVKALAEAAREGGLDF